MKRVHGTSAGLNKQLALRRVVVTAANMKAAVFCVAALLVAAPLALADGIQDVVRSDLAAQPSSPRSLMPSQSCLRMRPASHPSHPADPPQPKAYCPYK